MIAVGGLTAFGAERLGTDGALLVTLPADATVRRRIAEVLADRAVTYSAQEPRSRWPGVRAMLTGNLRRELPDAAPERFPDLEFVQTLYTGVDAFPFDRVPDRTAVAGNVGAYAPFVAEHAVALLLALARRLPAGHRQIAEGRLRPTEPLTHLGARTVLLVGYGAIAAEIAARLRPFGCRLVGVNRSGALRPGVDRMVPVAGLREELARAEAVVNVLPLTRASRGLFGAEALAALPPGAIFVNVGRAETVDPDALAHRMRSDPSFRVGLDVWWEEDFEHGRVAMPFSLAEFPNLLGSPHRAGVVPEARPYVLDRALENLARFFRGERPRYLADRAEYAP